MANEWENLFAVIIHIAFYSQPLRLHSTLNHALNCSNKDFQEENRFSIKIMTIIKFIEFDFALLLLLNIKSNVSKRTQTSLN